MNSFQHQQLNRAKNEIRLLTHESYLPSASALNDASLSFSITKVSLDDRADFVALSYVWGPRDFQGHVLLHSSTPKLADSVKITENLAQLLPTLVEFAAGRPVWIDALCINQSDDEEKGWQVALMRRIYQQASSVFIWLGPGANHGSLTLSKLDQVGQKVHSEPVLLKWEHRFWHSLFHHEPLPPYDIAQATGPPMYESVERLLKDYPVSDNQSASIPLTDTLKLLQRPWWQRVWVFQEIVLPGIECSVTERLIKNERIIFACGKTRSCLNHVGAALTVLRLFLLAREGILYSSGGRLVTLQLDRRAFIMVSSRLWTEKVPLLTLLQATSPYSIGNQRLAATDPRDRVFALLGITGDAQELGIIPNYTSSCERIYANVAAALIMQRGPDLMLLAHFPKQLCGLPTWAPDWSSVIDLAEHTASLSQGTTSHVVYKSMASVKSAFSPWGQVSENTSKPRFVKESRIMGIEGLHLATVVDTVDQDSWQKFRRVAYELLASSEPLKQGRGHTLINENCKPPATEEEARLKQAIDGRLRYRTPISKGIQQTNLPLQRRTAESDPFEGVPLDEDDEIWQNLNINPALELETVDYRNYKAYLTCIHDLHTELRRLCLSQATTYINTAHLEHALWRTPVADQYYSSPTHEWDRPSVTARQSALFSTMMWSALPINLDVASWPPWMQDLRFEWIRDKLTHAGLFAEPLSVATVKYILVNPTNEQRLQIIYYAPGYWGLGVRRYPDDGKPADVQSSAVFRPLHQLAVLCRALGHLQGDQYASEDRVVQGLADGSIDANTIVYAVRLEIDKTISVDEPQLLAMMIHMVRYLREAVVTSFGRTIFVTERGYLGIGPTNVGKDDLVVALSGSKALVVLRPADPPKDNGGCIYHYVGEAYVYGAMDGELAVDERGKAKLTQEFLII